MQALLKQNKKTSFFIAAIVLVGIAAYFNSFDNPFILDDQGTVINNHLLRSTSNIPKLFTTDLYYESGVTTSYYRPLQSLSYLLDFQLWQLNPAGYHLTNTLLHIFNSLLIFALITRLVKDQTIAFITALLFVCHPIYTEAVTYISGRADPLVFFFILLCVIAYMRSKESSRYMLASLACFSAALLTKEFAIITPLLLVLIDFSFSEKPTLRIREVSKRLAPFLIVVAAYVTLRIALLDSVEFANTTAHQIPIFARFLTFVYVVSLYIGLLVCPLGLHLRRIIIPFYSISNVSVVSAMIAFLLIVALAIHCYKKNRLLFFAITWFFITLIPQSSLIPINAFMAEHFLYLPAMGFFLAVAYTFKRFFSRRQLVVISTIIIVIYASLTIKQNAVWKNPFSFFQRLARYSPSSSIVHNHLGTLYFEQGNLKQAESEYRKAYAINPSEFSALANFVLFYMSIGENEKALAFYGKIKELYPNVRCPAVHNNIGIAFMHMGKFDKAIEEYERSLSINPTALMTHFNLAVVHCLNGEYDVSREEFYASLGIDFSALSRAKNLPTLDEYREAFRCGQPPAILYTNFGMLHSQHELFELARICFKKAVELSPDTPEPYFNLGILYVKLRQKKEAIMQFKSALKKDPTYTPAATMIEQLERL
ncbi:tetratricopeptide repeat protein [Candidatus Omnitrophota bacterium]